LTSRRGENAGQLARDSFAAVRDLLGAVEGGGTKFLCAIGSSHDRLLDRTRIETTEPRATLAAIVRFFAPYGARLGALGVSCFGPLELDPGRGRDYGSLLRTPKEGWSGVPVRAQLEGALAIPVAIDTDVNGAALAEQRWGGLRGADPAVYVTVGTGVGVGVAIAGRPLHGLVHPELGHLRAYDPDFAGVCPFHGACVEGLVSAPALRARTGLAPEQLPDDHPVWERVSAVLGQLLHAIVLAYSPERIAIGGGVLTRAALLPRLRQTLSASLGGYVPRPALSEPAISDYLVAPGLGERSGLAGGFALAEDALTASRPR
jgi:fructokinase